MLLAWIVLGLIPDEPLTPVIVGLPSPPGTHTLITY